MIYRPLFCLAVFFVTAQAFSIISMKYAVVGPAGGFNEAMAKKLSDSGIPTTIFYQELQGTSPNPKLELNDCCTIIQGDTANGEALSKALAGAKVVITCGDCGLAKEDTPMTYEPDALLTRVIEAAPTSSKVIAVLPASKNKKDSGGLFGSKSPEEALAARGGTAVGHGALFGAAVAPPPFLTGPKAVPQLDEAVRKRGVLLSTSPALALSARTGRGALAEAVGRLAAGAAPAAAAAAFYVVSVEDRAAPSEAQWAKEFARLDASKGLQVYSAEFGSVDRAAFPRWLRAKWGPKMLANLPVLDKIRTGARPTSVQPLGELGAAVQWETLDARTMEVVYPGRLEIQVEPAGLTVTRTDGKGGPLSSILPGEEEIIQSLIEGLNTVAFPRGYVMKNAPVEESAKQEELQKEEEAVAIASPAVENKERAARPGRKKTRVKKN